MYNCSKTLLNECQKTVERFQHSIPITLKKNKSLTHVFMPICDVCEAHPLLTQAHQLINCILLVYFCVFYK